MARWANIPIGAVGDLDLLDYLQFRRDCFIDRMRRTKEGMEYLDEAWLLSQTEPDRAASREIFGVRH